MLFPWNVFITGTEYLKSRLTGTIYVDKFNNFFSVGFMLSNFLILFYLSVMRGKQIPRILSALGCNLFIFFLCVLLTRMPEIDKNEFFAANMVMVIICGISTGFLQNGVFELASVFPSSVMTAVMSGQGLAGAAVAISEMTSKLVGQANTHDEIAFSAYLYFLFAFIIIVCCFGLVLVLIRLPGYKEVIDPVDEKSEDEESFLDDSDSASLQFSPKPEYSNFTLRLKILKKIWMLALSVFLVFFVTLSLFPSIVSIIEQVGPKKNPLFITGAFLVFALGDWFGKSIPGFAIKSSVLACMGYKSESNNEGPRSLSKAKKNSRRTLFFSILRLLFIPIFLFCNTVILGGDPPHPIERQFPLLVSDNIAYYLLVLIFAVSNGYLGSVAMSEAPSILGGDFGYEILGETLKEKEIAGSMMVFFLTAGLASGSFFSFFIRSALCGWCNPFNN